MIRRSDGAYLTSEYLTAERQRIGEAITRLNDKIEPAMLEAQAVLADVRQMRGKLERKRRGEEMNVRCPICGAVFYGIDRGRPCPHVKPNPDGTCTFVPVPTTQRQ